MSRPPPCRDAASASWLLVEAARRIIAGTEPSEIFELLCHEAVRATSGRAAIAAHAPGRRPWSDAVVATSIDGLDCAAPPDSLSSALYGLLRRVAARRTAQQFAARDRGEHVVLAGLAAVDELACGMVIALPVFACSGRVEAVLVVTGDGDAPFADIEVRILEELTRCASQALGNAALLERARADQQRLMMFAMADRDVMWSWDIVSGRVWWGSETLGCPLPRTGDPLGWKLERVHPDDAGRVRASLRHAMDADEQSWTDEYRVRRRDGCWVLVEDHGLVVRDASGRPIRFAGVMRDVTDRAHQEQLTRLNDELARRALHDPLTGLANRALLLDRLRRALERARGKPGSLALCFVDVDHFKRINDGLGHAAGDTLLVALARRLAAAVRSTDTVARIGGDEFVVLMEHVENSDAASTSVTRLTRAMQAPVPIGDRDVAVTVSAGLVVAGTGHDDAEALLRDADAAMYHAKERGRARVELFDGEMRARLVERLEAEAALVNALDDGQLRLFYQPEVDLGSGQVVGVEALLRWQHPERGLLPPSEFLTLAEETGRIIPIGLWVLREACRQINVWRRAHPALADFVVWVNLSSGELTRPGLVAFIRRLLADSGTPPSSLGIEITESALLDTDVAEGVLTALERVGVQLAIDDFGTGYSSLSYLRRFPVAVLKIDRSFVSGLGADAGDSAIVRAVVALAHSLGLRAIAEGVETSEQAAILRSLGCDLAQGFLFGQPADVPALDGMLADAVDLAPRAASSRGRRGSRTRA